MIPLEQVAKEIDYLERHIGMTRPEAERTFWAMYRYVECISSHESYGSRIERLLHKTYKDGMIKR